MGIIRAVVFDLDDTLYLETDYVSSGFREVARELASRTLLSEEDLFTFLWQGFQEGTRGVQFDRLLMRYSDLTKITNVSELVSLYRNHSPNIQLLDGINELLNMLELTGVLLGIITDGPVLSQTVKMRALGLESRIANRVRTDDWGIEYRKPHVRAFHHLSSELRVVPSECVYVGDNPQKDFQGAKLSGWKTIRLRMHLQLANMLEARDLASSADVEVRSVQELTELLAAYCKVGELTARTAQNKVY
jgi:putative hydrolase of the HAD superfamily